MPAIQAFRGLRYDLGHVGSLSDVICPPYDVIGPEFQDQLYKKHPANIIRLELNREEPGDDLANNRYTRASKFLKNWRSEGLLFTESTAAIYVYHQVFTYAGQTYTRRGFMARIRLQRFGEGNIYPHEETMSGPKQDRLLLTRACKANLSQIFGLYPDPKKRCKSLLEANVSDQAPVEATDHLGVVHRMWTVTDPPSLIAHANRLIGPKPIFIADGHHRYETACNYRDELASRGPLPSDHPANFVLMVCIGMDDPGLLVLPTHRLFRGLPEMNSDELIAKLAGCFTTRVLGEGSDLAPSVWEEIETGEDQGTLGLFTTKDERWVLAREKSLRCRSGADGRRLAPGAQRAMARVEREHPASPGDRHLAGLARFAEAQIRAPGRGSRPRTRHGRVPLGRDGHARHGRTHPHDQRTCRADARQEHLLLPQADRRSGHQSARNSRPRSLNFRPPSSRPVPDDRIFAIYLLPMSQRSFT